MDAAYYFDGDIELPAQGAWQLPDGFSGSFTGPADADSARLWDEASNTIFIQNPYQLAVLASEDREGIPIVTGDANSKTFGMGELLLEGGDQTVLAYSPRHNYVLSAAFTAQVHMPTVLSLGASPLRGATQGGAAGTPAAPGTAPRAATSASSATRTATQAAASGTIARTSDDAMPAGWALVALAAAGCALAARRRLSVPTGKHARR